MKKIICLALIVLLCACAALPAVAAGGFVKSITYKGSPDLVVVDGKGGNIVRHDDVEVLETIGSTEEGCLVITPVAEAKKTEQIPDEAKELLLKVFAELSDGTMKLPYEEVEGINAEKMVIRELLDITLICDHDHASAIKDDDIGIELTMDLGVAKDDVLSIMSYVDGKWIPAVSITNNGDGTVTFVLEDLCPVAFAIEA